MKELVVVAIGGNSIIKDNASQSIEHQAEAVKAVAWWYYVTYGLSLDGLRWLPGI